MGIVLDSITCDFFVYDQKEGEGWIGQLHCIVICGIMSLRIYPLRLFNRAEVKGDRQARIVFLCRQSTLLALREEDKHAPELANQHLGFLVQCLYEHLVSNVT